MSLTDEGNTPSKEQTASKTPEHVPSNQNGTSPGLPGLAGFGQTMSYAPVTAQAPAETEIADTVQDPVLADDPEYPDTLNDLEFDEATKAPDFTEALASLENNEMQQPATEEPANLFDDAHLQTQGLYDDLQGLSKGQEPSFENLPDLPDLEPGADMGAESFEPVEPVADDNMEAFSGEDHGDDIQAMDHAAASGFDAGLGLNPDAALHADTSNSLQTFEAHYDQHPEIPLGAFSEPGEGIGQQENDQPFFHEPEPEQEGDADFLSAEPGTEIAEPPARKGRTVLMATSGLIGIMALGGALAFAYKIGGDSDIASTGKPPLIQADNRPVKVAPSRPGGKQFPHKNKKIYERLQGANSQVAERLVPRQESVAVAATAALGAAQPATAKITAPAPVAAAPAGAPRKVKTLTVRPDGTIEPATPRQKVLKAPEPVTTASIGKNTGAGISMSFPQPASAPPAATPPVAAAPVAAPPVKAAAPALPRPVAATPPPAPARAAPALPAPLPSATQRARSAAPTPVQKPRAPAPQRVAARPASAPATAPAVSSSNYVVQVAARKSQTDALAAFADIQQKYPQLLSGYRPIIKRADLGSKGVWYRLNVGPVKNKKLASNLCSSLKGAGMRSCIIRAQ